MVQTITLIATILLSFTSAFADVVFSPTAKAPSDLEQVRVSFGTSMTPVDDAFSVDCDPGVKGVANWADNNTTWVFTFESKGWNTPRIPGGGSCNVVQTKDLKDSSGKTYAAGSLQHHFVVAGPEVNRIYLAPGASTNGVREANPLFLITFNGAIDKQSIFNNPGSFAYYSMDNGGNNLPAGKMLFQPVPADQEADLFKQFEREYYIEEAKKTDQWVFVTVNESLVPGAKINLSITGVLSAYASQQANTPNDQQFSVRKAFNAEVSCSRTPDRASCRPEGDVSVNFNAKTKWADAKNITLTFLDRSSGEMTTVNPVEDNVVYDWLGWIASGLGVDVSDDAIVESVNFGPLKIAPSTTATINYPANMLDIDGRPLNNNQQTIAFSDFSEVIRMPRNLVVMEKNLAGNDSLPIGILNLNQSIVVRKTGPTPEKWEPIQDKQSIMNFLDAMNDYYPWQEKSVSPLALTNPTSSQNMQMTGQKNQQQLFSFGLGEKKKGLYGIELFSELFNSNNRDSYDIAAVMITDLNTHMRVSENGDAMVWVTSYSSNQPVANAKITIYGCGNQFITEGSSNDQGLYLLKWQDHADKCGDNNSSSKKLSVFAETADDMGFTSYRAYTNGTNVFSASNIEYNWDMISDGQLVIHPVIGVNLAKPGQTVPVQLLANELTANGFRTPSQDKLPRFLSIVSGDNSDVSFDFPIEWNNGRAEVIWKIPKAIDLATFYLSTKDSLDDYGRALSENIEVSEFKVPVMSANLALPKDALISPTSIPVTSLIRYANGVGAKDQEVEVSYYVERTFLKTGDYESFAFSMGKYDPANELSVGTTAKDFDLPSEEQVAIIKGLTTDENGQLELDLATQSVDGQSLSERMKASKMPWRLVTRLRYQDQTGEFQTESAAQDIYDSSAYIGVDVDGKVEAGELRVVVVGVDGKAYTNPNDLDAKVISLKANVIGEELFGGLIKNEINTELVETNWTANCKLQDSVYSCAATGLPAGKYVFQVSSKTNGQQSYATFNVDKDGSINGSNDYYYQEENFNLAMATDKADYKGGDTAKVSFEAPWPECIALVTLERSSIEHAKVDAQACANGYVNVPVFADNAPNTYASVYLVAGRQGSSVSLDSMDLGKPSYRQGYAKLKIDWARFAADVVVNTDSEEYKPGDTAEVVIEVAAQQGNLEQADVTLVVIEEKILSLKQNNTYDVLSALMGERDHNINVFNNHSFLESVAQVEATTVAEAISEEAAKVGDEGGSGSALEEFQRKVFDSLVSFQPRVPVVNGVARTSFKVNDKLAKFKVFAIVNDTSKKFGVGETAYLSAQEIQTFSNLPVAARTGDSFPMMVNLQNTGKNSGQFTVAIEVLMKDANGKTVGTSQSNQVVSLGAGDANTISIGNLQIADKATSMDYNIRVTNENGVTVDNLVVSELTVSPAVPLSVQDEFLAQMQDSQWSIDLTKSEKALEGDGQVQTLVYSSLVDSAQASMETKMAANRFLDLTPEGQVLKAIISSKASDEAAVKDMFAELMAQTDSNGMIKYWRGAERGNFWLTADLIDLMGMKPFMVNLVPSKLKNQWLATMNQVATSGSTPSLFGSELDEAQDYYARLRAVLAGMVLDSNMTATALEYANSLEASPQSIAQLDTRSLVAGARIVAATKPATFAASPVTKQIMAAKLLLKDTTAMISGQPSYGWWGYSDEVVLTAKFAGAVSSAHRATGDSADKNYLDNLVKGLTIAGERQQWYTTRTQAWVLNGLNEFAKTYEAAAVSGVTSIENSESAVATKVNWAPTMEDFGQLESWIDNQATITVTHNGDGKPWVSVIAKEAVVLEKPNYQGIKIEKTEKNLTSGSGANVGDIIQVELTITTTSNSQHLAAFDPIPAGANILSEGWGGFSSAQKSYEGYKLYFSYLPAGTYTVSYQYQLNNPGTFQMPPTRIEALYEPGYFGETPNATKEVVK